MNLKGLVWFVKKICQHGDIEKIMLFAISNISMTNFSINTINPKFLLILSRAIAALRTAIIAILIARGMELSGGIEMPISFCNVLFVGNLCAALTVGFWFGFSNILEDLKSLNLKILGGLFLNGCLATLLSGLIFVALKDTSVTNAVLLARFGPVLYALGGALLLKKKISIPEWFGFSLIGVGVLAIVFKTNNYQINRGDLLILGSAVVYALISLLGKTVISDNCSLRTIVFTRNFISAIVFFCIAIVLFGPIHFRDVVSGRLWIIMGIYAFIVIVLAQILWYASLGKLDSRTVGRLTVFSPVFGVIYALLLNGERPSGTQIIAFIIIMIGVAISTFGKSKPKEKEKTIELSQEAESTASTS